MRVQRRPVGGRPPVAVASAAPLRARSAARTSKRTAAILHDDTGDPALTLDMYEDGDHVAARRAARYTEIFFNRLRPLFQ